MSETLMVELGPDIGITIVTPGFIESELTKGKHFTKEGKLEVDQDLRDVSFSILWKPMKKKVWCKESR